MFLPFSDKYIDTKVFTKGELQKNYKIADLKH